MKSIGFLDFSLHNFHAETFLKLSRNFWEKRGWAVDRCWAMKEAESRAWAAQNSLHYVDDWDELRNCSGLMVLAPSNSEAHLELAERAFAFGIPTYVDKPFAPNLKTAKQIFDRADAKHVPVMTTSALRCAPSFTAYLKEVGKPNVRHMRTWAGNGDFEEYAIHALELVVSAMGPNVVQLMQVNTGGQYQLHLRFSEQRTGTVFFHPHSATRYQAMASTAEETRYIDCTGAAMFEALGNLIVDFLESKRELIDRRESLMIRRILDLVISEESHDCWVDLKDVSSVDSFTKN